MTPGRLVLVTRPKFFGKFETTIGKLLASPYGFEPAVIVSGAPEDRLKTAPSCQRSTSREMTNGALDSHDRPGPKGSSNVPLLRKSCVRCCAESVLFPRSLGFTMLVLIVRLHV